MPRYGLTWLRAFIRFMALYFTALLRYLINRRDEPSA
jgi:hypothetical protein